MNAYQERLDRTRAAVALEQTDRVPVSYLGNAVNARFTGVSLHEYCRDMELNCTTNLKALEQVGEVDSTQATIFFPWNLSITWLSEVMVPGDGLPENDMWQVHEKELMKQDDYDTILEGGFGPWYEKFLRERAGDPMSRNGEFFAYMPKSVQRFAEAGIPSINGGSFYSPFEMICGGRSLVEFFTEDMFEIPDKLDAVFQVIHEYNMTRFEERLKNPDTRPIGLWVGCWRGTPDSLSPDMFERYSWKYLTEIIDLLISYDVIPILHLDSKWDSGLKYFLQVPSKKCIMSLDGQTDIFLAKEILGEHMCLMGDVPASMTAFATSEDVTMYCQKLIRGIGPKGFILGSGCDLPFNAKLENVQAMVNSVKL